MVGRVHVPADAALLEVEARRVRHIWIPLIAGPPEKRGSLEQEGLGSAQARRRHAVDASREQP